MTDDKCRAPESGSLQSRVFRPANKEELEAAIEAAFDYRGDVTLELREGTTVEGYVSNRNAAADPPFLEIFPKDAATTRIITYGEVSAVAFTGTDTASGKSWEAWVNKKAAQRQAEVQRVMAEAQARGHL
jgi:hypothetical protein